MISRITKISIPLAARRFDVEALIPAALMPIYLCLLGPWWIVYEFHPDEGVNLIKAALVANGYHLYDQIWNDQPPVLTLILAAIHWLFPFNVGIARAVIIAFSSLLLWSLFRIVRRTDGSLAAWAAVATLGLSSLYLLFSASVMIGLPAIALAVCALDQAMIGVEQHSRRRFLVAGVIFGLSLQIKMFTGLVLPSLICAVLFGRNAPASQDVRRGGDVAVTLAAVLATFLAIAIAFHEPLLDQLILPHWQESRSETFDLENHGWIYFGQLLTLEPTLLGFGIIGVIAVLLRPRQVYGAPLMPVLWLIISVMAFTHHKPVWPHHLPMTLVPMAWLGGCALGKAAEWLRATGVRTTYRNAIAFALFGALIIAGAWDPPRFGTVPPLQNPIAAAMGEMKTDMAVVPWVVTDTAIDAYRASVLIPPELAVFTGKRLRQGYLTSETIIRAIRERKPSQVMFRRFSPAPQVLEFLNNSSYTRKSSSADFHYLRSDLVRSNPGSITVPSLPWPN